MLSTQFNLPTIPAQRSGSNIPRTFDENEFADHGKRMTGKAHPTEVNENHVSLLSHGKGRVSKLARDTNWVYHQQEPMTGHRIPAPHSKYTIGSSLMAGIGEQ